MSKTLDDVNRVFALRTLLRVGAVYAIIAFYMLTSPDKYMIEWKSDGIKLFTLFTLIICGLVNFFISFNLDELDTFWTKIILAYQSTFILILIVLFYFNDFAGAFIPFVVSLLLPMIIIWLVITNKS